jgi:hypothetical protein
MERYDAVGDYGYDLHTKDGLVGDHFMVIYIYNLGLFEGASHDNIVYSHIIRTCCSQSPQGFLLCQP